MTRRSWTAGLLGVLWACNAGPISDFPYMGDPTSPDVSQPGAADAGVFRPGDGGLPGSGSAETDASLPSVDGGAFPGGHHDGGVVFPPALDGGISSDAGVLAPDAGPVSPDPSCPSAGPGECAGAYCGLTAGELLAESQPGRACTRDAWTLNAVCDGSLATATGFCAQIALGQGQQVSAESVRACVGASTSVPVADGCVSCFAAEMACALRECSAGFLSGNAEAAALCRATRCADSFSACSGLPAAWLH